jgi:aspartyl-tRNA(Asn)/glutamyl-tRNA(Gln) amidotransferase subunit A
MPVDDYMAALGKDVKGMRIGVPRNYFFDNIDPEVEAHVRAVIHAFEAEGAILSEVDIPYPEQIMGVEFTATLSEAGEYHRRMLRRSPELYEDDVRLLIEAGEFIPATKYIQGLRVRRLMQREWAKVYEEIDVMVAPTVPAPAAPAGQATVRLGGVDEPVTWAYVRLSAPSNILGLPTISTPCGFTKGGLPIGFQAIARPFAETTALRLCDAYQRMTDWHEKRPVL